MKQSPSGTGSAGVAALLAAVLCLAGTAVHAQFTSYSTNFDSTDIVNGAPASGFTAYSSASPYVANLDGQNNWASTDPAPASAQSGNNIQINGGSDYVGPVGSFFGGTFAGAIGGNQRSSSPSTSAPDVVPSAASGGVISLYHPITVGGNAPRLTLDVDFTLTSPVTFTSRDSFGFSLRNASGNASLISLNFTPNATFTDPNTGQPVLSDNVTTTVGTAAGQMTGSAVVLSSAYHLHLVLTAGVNGTYAATLTDPSSGASRGAFNGSLNTASITLASVARFTADWTLVNSAASNVSNGGYAGTAGNFATGAGDNTLAFDNLVITVPEPSTYAVLALGLLGLVKVRRWHGRQA